MRLIAVGTGYFDQEVVGESNYQDELRFILGQVGPGGRVSGLLLAPEPDNQFDSTAVAIRSPRGNTVGYLPRDTAAEVHRCLVDFMLGQDAALTCAGQLAGGDAERPSIGLWIDFDVKRFLRRTDG